MTIVIKTFNDLPHNPVESVTVDGKELPYDTLGRFLFAAAHSEHVSPTHYLHHARFLCDFLPELAIVLKRLEH